MAGDIAAPSNSRSTRTNDTLAAPSAPVTVEPIVFPNRATAPPSGQEQGDEEKAGAGAPTT